MTKFSDCSKVVKFLLAAGGISAALVSIAVPTVWALETHFVTVTGLENAFIVRDIRNIKRMIRKLDFLEKRGTISDLELYELEGLRVELEELTEE